MKYKIAYHTAPAPGLTYYRGEKTIEADDEEEAQESLILDLHRYYREWSYGAFREYIVVEKVTPVK